MIPKDLLDYFLYPKATGYDVPKTLLYGLVLVVAMYYIYKMLVKLKIKIDKRLAIAVAPWVLFGSVLRVTQDAGLVSSYWFVTPGIYVLVFLIVFALLVASSFLQKKKGIPYHKVMFAAGLIVDLCALLQLNFVNYYGILLVAAFFAPWPIIFYFVKKWGLVNRFVVLLHLFDATTTAVSLKFFSYSEQHVFPRVVIGLSDPFLFIPIKLVGVAAVILLIDKYSDDKNFNNYLKLCIGILGAATGLRDFISLFAMI
jgi:uncharacterized membrane protein